MHSTLYQHYDAESSNKSVRLYRNMLVSLGQVVNQMYSWDTNTLIRMIPKSRYMDMMWADVPPVINDTYVVNASLECLMSIVYSLSALAENPEKKSLATTTSEIAWTTLLPCLSILLEKSNEEIFIQVSWLEGKKKKKIYFNLIIFF